MGSSGRARKNQGRTQVTCSVLILLAIAIVFVSALAALDYRAIMDLQTRGVMDGQ